MRGIWYRNTVDREIPDFLLVNGKEDYQGKQYMDKKGIKMGRAISSPMPELLNKGEFLREKAVWRSTPLLFI